MDITFLLKYFVNKGLSANNVAQLMTTNTTTSTHQGTLGMNDTINAISAPKENQIDTNSVPIASTTNINTNNDSQTIHI